MKRNQNLSAPLQLWLPLFMPAVDSADLGRDLERAQRCWAGDTVVWCAPDFPRSRRWLHSSEPWPCEMALRSETLNRIDIFHISESGKIGLDWSTRFTKPTVESLLGDWLTAGADPSHPRHGLKVRDAKEEVVLRFPRFVAGDKVAYVKLTGVGQPIETSRITIDGDTLVWHWPPKDLPLTVSPADESREYYGDFDWVDVQQEDGTSLRVLRSRKRGVLSMPCVDVWPGRLERLFPLGGGTGAPLSARKMAELAERSTVDHQAALDEALVLERKHTCPSQAERLHAWFYPLLAEGEENALWALEAEHELRFESVSEALRSPEFRAKMKEMVPVTRCFGVIGLFSTLLVQQLQSGGATFRRCERCGRIIHGPRNKRLCGRQDNEDCFKARRAADRQRERAKKRRSVRTTRES